MAVQLTGYQGPRGFKAEQVYDPSAQMQKAADRDAQIRADSLSQYKDQIQQIGSQIEKNHESDLRALSQFSNTLSESLVKFQERENDRQYKIGLAEVMNGNAQLPESTIQDHNAKVETLRASAEADGEVANNIEAQGDTKLAETFRSESKAISGWRAYGRAVGTAKQAGNNSIVFLSEFMTRTAAIVPMPDGTFKSPAEIGINGTPAQVQAALAVAQQEYFQKTGLNEINPVVLAEHFAGTFQSYKAQIANNVIQKVAANKRENAVAEIDGQIQSGVNTYSTTEELSTLYHDSVKNYMIYGGLNRSEASKKALENLQNRIISEGEEGKILLARLETVRKFPNSPTDKSTLGSLHKTEFDGSKKAIEDAEYAELRRAEQTANSEVGKIWANYQSGLLTVKTKQEQQALFDSTMQLLGGYDTALATQYRTQVSIAQSSPVDYSLYNRLQATMGTEAAPTEGEIDSYRDKGLLTVEQANGLKAYAYDFGRQKFVKENQTLANQLLQNLLGEQLQFDLFNNPKTHPAHVKAATSDALNNTFTWVQGRIKEGKPPQQNEVLDYLGKQIAISQRQYLPTTPDKRLVKDLPNLGTVDKIATPSGKMSVNLTNTSPAEIKGRYNPANTLVLSREELEQNIPLFMNGQPLTPRAASLVKELGISGRRLIKDQAAQHGIDTNTFDNSAAVQSTRANYAAAPNAALRFEVGAGSPLQRQLQLVQIAEAKARQQRYEYFKKGSRAVGPNEPMAPVDILRLVLNQGFSEKDAVTLTAIAMAESGGRPGAHNPRYPDNSYGLWQINMLDEPGYELGKERARALKLNKYEDLTDPEINAAAMRYVYDRQGMNAWSVYKNGTGSYKYYLPDARHALAALRQQ